MLSPWSRHQPPCLSWHVGGIGRGAREWRTLGLAVGDALRLGRQRAFVCRPSLLLPGATQVGVAGHMWLARGDWEA